MTPDPYNSLSATRRLNQRYCKLWGLGIGERQDIAAQRPTVLRDILAEFNRQQRTERRSRVYPPWRMVVTPAAKRQAGSSPQPRSAAIGFGSHSRSI